MKFRKEESIPKLDKCWALFKNHLLVAQEQHPRSSRLMIPLLFHLPAKGCSKSQRCVKPGPWFTALQDIRRMNAANPTNRNLSSFTKNAEGVNDL